MPNHVIERTANPVNQLAIPQEDSLAGTDQSYTAPIVSHVDCRNNGINAEYIGETGKSIFQRSTTHYQAFRYRRTHSFMLRHCMQSHPLEDPEESRFGWEVLSKEPTCLRWQVSEALRIRESREKENKQRETITKQFIEETN